jgi:GntR family transcriptional regulator, rspAB operon transcriptional repressor
MPKKKTTKKSAARKQKPPKVSLSDAAYNALREGVLNLTLPAGELLNERWICELVGFGRTPVHQALQRLHQEGLIEIVPRKGVLVTPDSVARIIDLLDARSLIEPVLAGRAARLAVPDDLKELKQIVASPGEQTGGKANSVDRFIERDRAFHAKLAEIGGSPVLVEMQRSLHERAMRFWYSDLWRTLDESKATAEHAAVIAAIERGDAQAAETAMRQHINEITARLRKIQAMSPRQAMGTTAMAHRNPRR